MFDIADIIHEVGIQAPVSKVYAALSTVEGVASWWTRETTSESKPGGRMKVRFQSPTGAEVGKLEFELAALEPKAGRRRRN